MIFMCCHSARKKPSPQSRLAILRGGRRWRTRGLSADDCVEAGKLEWQRKLEGVLRPGMSPADRKKAIADAMGNAAIARRAGTWHALAELLNGTDTHTGRLQMGTQSEAEGGRKPHDPPAFTGGHKPKDRGAADPLPRRHDAPGRGAALPAPAVCAGERGGCRASHAVPPDHRRLGQDYAGAKREEAAPAENRGRAAKTVAELRDFVLANSGGDALVITYQAIEGQLAGPGIRTEHFNAVSGLDVYRDVRSLFIIGRPLPDAYELRTMALALTGRPVALETGQKETRGALMADGTGAGITVRGLRRS